jgi:hypothetical protein
LFLDPNNPYQATGGGISKERTREVAPRKLIEHQQNQGWCRLLIQPTCTASVMHYFSIRKAERLAGSNKEVRVFLRVFNTGPLSPSFCGVSPDNTTGRWKFQISELIKSDLKKFLKRFSGTESACS